MYPKGYGNKALSLDSIEKKINKTTKQCEKRIYDFNKTNKERLQQNLSPFDKVDYPECTKKQDLIQEQEKIIQSLKEATNNLVATTPESGGAKQLPAFVMNDSTANSSIDNVLKTSQKNSAATDSKKGFLPAFS
jgi:DNA-directed RNA polymerase beta' subunit